MFVVLMFVVLMFVVPILVVLIFVVLMFVGQAVERLVRQLPDFQRLAVGGGGFGGSVVARMAVAEGTDAQPEPQPPGDGLRPPWREMCRSAEPRRLQGAVRGHEEGVAVGAPSVPSHASYGEREQFSRFAALAQGARAGLLRIDQFDAQGRGAADRLQQAQQIAVMGARTEADLVMHAERREVHELFENPMEFRQAALVAAEGGVDAQADAVEAESGEQGEAFGVERGGRQIQTANRRHRREGKSGIETKHQFGDRFRRELPRRAAAEPQARYWQRPGQQRVNQLGFLAEEADIAIDGFRGALDVDAERFPAQRAEALVAAARHGLDIAIPGQHAGVKTARRGRDRAQRWLHGGMLLSLFAEHGSEV